MTRKIPTQALQKLTGRIPRRFLKGRPALVIVVALFGLVGVLLLLGSHAATYFVSKEAESGTLSGASSVVTDSTASGGAAVSFGATTPPPPPPTLKPMAAGLYTAGPPASSESFIDHAFLNIDWATLEPSQGSFNWTSIDSVISAHPTLKLRIRVFSGLSAPSWVKSLGGGCVNITTNSGASGCEPRFWTSEYMTAYQGFVQAAAKKYDAASQVLDLVNGACMTATDEPFILGGPSVGAALYAAGLRQQNYGDCITGSSAALSQAFPHTRFSVAGHLAWQIPTASGITSSWPAERDLLNQLRSQYGKQMIIQDNGLANQTCSQTNPDPLTAGDLWCFMKGIATPKGFQQGCGSKVTTCNQDSVLQYGYDLGACFLEHADFTSITDAQSWDTKLKNNTGCQG